MPHFAAIHLTRKTSLGHVGNKTLHNERVPGRARNADPERADLNERLVGDGDVVGALRRRLDTVSRTIRKDAVPAIELEITTSNGHFDPEDREGIRAWADRTVEWAKDRYGPENVVYATLHRDETTPNIHLMITPITPDGRLSAKEVVGNEAKMRALHTDYHEKVGRHVGLDRGVEGSRATHTDLDRWGAHMKAQERDAWELAQEIARAPRDERHPEQSIALAAAPLLQAAQIRGQYWREQAEAREAQLAGSRDREGSAHTRQAHDSYRQLAAAVRGTPLDEVARGMGGVPDPHDPARWRIGEARTLTLRGERFRDDATGRRGSGAIDLVRATLSLPFREAVDYLNMRHHAGHALGRDMPPGPAPRRDPEPDRAGDTQAAPPPPRSGPEPNERPRRDAFDLPPAFNSQWAAFRAYLIWRGLDEKTIDRLHAKGDIYATVSDRGHTNGVFVSRDEAGTPTGAALQGTTARGWQGRAPGNAKDNGAFTMEYGTPNGFERETLVLVDSPMDALGYAALRQGGYQYGRIMAPDGTGTVPTGLIDAILARDGRVRAAFANDGPGGGGAEQWARMQAAYPEQTRGLNPPITRHTPKGKEWGDDLFAERAKGHGAERGAAPGMAPPGPGTQPKTPPGMER